MFINLTPHTIVLHGRNGRVEIPASGNVARVSQTRSVLDEDAGPEYGHVDLVRYRPDQVTGLPTPEPGTIYIVSGQVLVACAGRSDVFAPDTDKGAVRDPGGRIVGTTALVAAPLQGR